MQPPGIRAAIRKVLKEVKATTAGAGGYRCHGMIGGNLLLLLLGVAYAHCQCVILRKGTIRAFIP